MPRLETNNPTERIMRVIAEYGTWIAAFDQLTRDVKELGIPINLVPRPLATEFTRETEFLHSNQRRARYNRSAMRTKRVLRDEREAQRARPRENPSNYRKAAQYAVTNGFWLQGEGPPPTVDMLMVIIEGVGLQTFLSSVRGPNNQKIVVEDLGLEYEGLGQQTGVDHDTPFNTAGEATN